MNTTDAFVHSHRIALLQRLANHPMLSDDELTDGLILSSEHAEAARIALGWQPFDHHTSHQAQVHTLWAACNVLGVIATTEERISELSRHRVDMFVILGRSALIVEVKKGIARGAAVTQVLDYAERYGRAATPVVVAGAFDTRAIEMALDSRVAFYTGDEFIRSVLRPFADFFWSRATEEIAA